jgi:hypothetical protein
MDGLAAWFDLELADGVSLSNAPTERDSVWRQVFFPFASPIHVTQGELVAVRLACVRSAQTRDLWWTWQATAPGGSAHGSSFQGITFRVAAPSPDAAVR